MLLPLYLIVAKFKPTKFGSKNVSLPASQVPSPTCSVSELYVLLPGGASSDMIEHLQEEILQNQVETTMRRSLKGRVVV